MVERRFCPVRDQLKSSCRFDAFINSSKLEVRARKTRIFVDPFLEWPFEPA